MADGWTLAEACERLHPPIPRRDLTRIMRGVEPLGRMPGRRGRPPASYPIDEIMRRHAEWVKRDRPGR